MVSKAAVGDAGVERLVECQVNNGVDRRARAQVYREARCRCDHVHLCAVETLGAHNTAGDRSQPNDPIRRRRENVQIDVAVAVRARETRSRSC